MGPSGIVVGFARFDFRKITKYVNLVNVGLLSDRRPDETSEADFRPTAGPFRLVLATHKCQPAVSVVSRTLGQLVLISKKCEILALRVITSILIWRVVLIP